MKLHPDLERTILNKPGVVITRTGVLPLPAPPLDCTEERFQSEVIQLANGLGWLVAHFRRVRVQRANGEVYYETPVQADGKGFPDLVMVRGSRCIVAELKSEKGRVSPEQRDWLDAFRRLAPAIEVHVWRPRNWDDILAALK